MAKTTILIADDHPMLRHGVQQLLERQQDFDVVAEAADGYEAVKLAGELKPRVVVMDIGMPKLSGLEATRQIKTKNPATAVLVFTVYDNEEYIKGLLVAGAAGYLLKNAYGDELINAIRAICTGELVIDPLVARRLLKSLASVQPKPAKLEGIEELTKREIGVLKLAAEGMSNQQIAVKLGISLGTVKGHMVTIFGKMAVGSRTEAVLKALKLGLIILED